MDVAGAAIGIASLGIQISQGLLDYYKACEGYDDDIKEAQSWLTYLQRTLSILGDTLQSGNSKTDVFQNAQSCLLLCEEGILKLEKKLRKIHRKYPATAIGHTKAVGRRFIYPFHQSTIAKLKEIVRDLLGHLVLSVQLVQADGGHATHAAALGIDDRLRSLSLTVDGLDVAARSHHAKLQALSDEVEDVRAGTIAMRQELSGLPDAIRNAVAGLLSQNQSSGVTRSNGQAIAARTNLLFDMLNWLAAPDPSLHHLRARRLHVHGTGEWLLQSPTFTRWLTGRTKVLWIPGEQGTGKTVLCSQAIVHATEWTRPLKGEVVVYFYFSALSAERERTPYERLLLSMVVQLVDRQDDSPPELVSLYSQNDQCAASLESLVLDLMRARVKVCVIVDGLDECNTGWGHRQEVIDGLARILAGASNLALLITSRPEQDIKSFMELQTADILRLDTATVHRDTQLFCRARIDRSPILSDLPQMTRQNIAAQLVEKSSGMFLWVKLQIDRIEATRWYATTTIEGALLDLPRNIDDIYASSIARLDEGPIRNRASTALHWAAFACRPLMVDELLAVCEFDIGADLYLGHNGAERVSAILGPVASLVHISESPSYRLDSTYHDRAQSTVTLSHWSVQEYLLSRGAGDGAKLPSWNRGAYQHASIARTCMSYLIRYGPDSQSISVGHEGTPPLLRYSLRYWRRHFDQACESIPAPQDMIELRRRTDLLVSTSASMVGHLMNTPGSDRAVHFASLRSAISDSPEQRNLQLGRPEAPQHRSLESPELSMTRFATPLQKACAKGNVKLVKTLLKRGARVNDSCGEFCCALQVAAYCGHTEIVQVLLAARANVNQEGGRFGSALQAAISADHDEVVDLLLEHGADVNTNASTAESGHADVSRSPTPSLGATDEC
ncbi:hypothetical protein LTR95_006651 [Oleoguttula sp. CCFEE 5521]